MEPLEQVEVHAERVGEHRLDDVAVADRHPDRPGAVLGLERASRRRTAVTARACMAAIDSPPGKAAADGWVCTIFHSFSLASSLSGRPCQSP